MTAAWKLDLPPTEKAVLVAMVDHARDDGSHCYPSIERIAAKTGFGQRAVQSAINRLRARGILVVVAYERGGRGHATEYQIDLSKGALAAFFMADKGARDAPIGREKDAPGAPIREKGVSAAPFDGEKGAHDAPIGGEKGASDDTKGAPGAQKGASDDVKGAPRAPQPLEPSIQPSENHQEDAAPAATSSPASPAGDGLEATPLHPSGNGRDPRTNSPAIQLFRRVTGRRPPAPNYERVIRIFGDAPTEADEAWARECYATWTGKGHKPTNLDWVFDWYRHGIREKSGNREWRRQRPAPEESAGDPGQEEIPAADDSDAAPGDPDGAAAIWERALKLIRMQMTPATFDLWVKSTRGESFDGREFRVWVTSEYAQDWLANRLHKTIRRTLVKMLGVDVEVHYVRADGPEICPDRPMEVAA